MIRGCAVISIITIMTGTATTPLITAVQYRALMGLIGLRVIPTPAHGGGGQRGIEAAALVGFRESPIGHLQASPMA